MTRAIIKAVLLKKRSCIKVGCAMKSCALKKGDALIKGGKFLHCGIEGGSCTREGGVVKGCALRKGVALSNKGG